MKKRGEIVPHAIGNHRVGYNGEMVARDSDGRERVILNACDHRHETTAGARTCAVQRFDK